MTVRMRKDEAETRAWVNDLETDTGSRFTFIRLVPRGDGVAPAQTYTTDYADIDVDSEGNVIGVTIPMWGEG